jgi:2-methylisocitrate lyase-like PEP mutase family enzyme
VTNQTFGNALRTAISGRKITCFLGVYDVFSASLAARHYDAIFVSGFGFSASHYGLPDIGFITWSDMVAFVQRLRLVLPTHHILVDIDDGYGDPEVAAHVVSSLARAGASGVVLEDQKRPRRCGHVGGKQIMELDEFLVKLDRVLKARGNMFVVARTDATDDAERLRRAQAFDATEADAVLVDGIESLELLPRIKSRIAKPLMFNQIAGGKSPACSLGQLMEAGVSLVNYSTPCLFAAQEAIEGALQHLKQMDGRLPVSAMANLSACNARLSDSLARRDQQPPFRTPSTQAVA